MGKTSLARKLYSHGQIRKQFMVFVWTCLPPRVRFEQIEEMILEKVLPQVGKKPAGLNGGSGGEDASIPTAPALSPQQRDNLKDILRGHEYLVVLDGLVDISSWNSLLNLLPGLEIENPKSRILVTTQLSEKEIIKNGGPDDSIGLDPLDITEAFQLFRERVSGADAVLDSNWEKVEKKFRKKVRNVTRGLPLAVIVLGGILRTKAYPNEWKEVFAEKLETSIGDPKALRCLWLLAFEELPNHLKSCFLYLATASENILLDPARLVRLWIAEGFVAPRNGQTLEEVGLGYLKELISRGLVDVAKKDARGGIKRVFVHSLLHSFVQAEAQESGFVEVHHNAGVLNPHAVRRLSIHNFVDSYVDIPDKFPKLRSLLCNFLEKKQAEGSRSMGSALLHGQQPMWPWNSNPAEWLMRACGGPAASDKKKLLHQLSIVKGSRFLRVIDLYGLNLERVPDEIGTVIHLRYLSIRNCDLSSELPASISELHNLQTLDLRDTKVLHNDNIQTFDVQGTKALSVPDEFWEIRGLRHVLADALPLPKCRSSHLNHLQTLTAVEHKWSPNGCCPLNHMIYLRSLAVSSIPNSKPAVAALLLALQKMEFLISLSLSGSLLPSGVLTNPSSRYLEEITLDGKLEPTPSGQFILPNLVKLTLSNKSGSGTFTQDFVDKVAALPNLNEMELLDGSYGETKLVFGESGFPSLTKLKLINLVQLETLELLQGSLPELAILTTRGCTKMNIVRQRNFFKPRGSSTGEEGLVTLPTSGWEEDVKMELSNRYEKHASVMRDEEEGFGPMMATSRSDGDVWMEQSKRFEEHAAVMRDDELIMMTSHGEEDLIVRTLKAKLEAVTQESQEIKRHFAEQISVIKEQNYQLIGNLQDQEETIFQLREELEQQHKCNNALEKLEHQIMKTNFDRMQRELEKYKKNTLENLGVHEEGCTSKR
ncbi:unnamed protein product [Urochloa decumbens]|uniref:NB-ARC domain-containing protein n=1 Tax=Urochloa decumbens TaxID=240449 RepID=A0ABC9B3Q8_9POAL